MFRHNGNSFGGGLRIHDNKGIPVKQLNSRKDESETLFLVINLCLRKRLIVSAYKPPEQMKSVFMSKSVHIYLDAYENVILLDFSKTLKDKTRNFLKKTKPT